VGVRFSARPDRPWGPPSILYNGCRVFPGDKVWTGCAADHSPPSSARSLGGVELYLLGHNRACNMVTFHYFAPSCHFDIKIVTILFSPRTKYYLFNTPFNITLLYVTGYHSNISSGFFKLKS
jgi:hypothetical protein